MQLICMNSVATCEGPYVGVTESHEGDTWKVRQKHDRYGNKIHMEHHKKFKFEICQELVHTLA